MESNEAMVWFLITVVGFFGLMVIGTYLAAHTYDKHAGDPHPQQHHDHPRHRHA